MAKKICLISSALLFLFTVPSFAQLGLTLRATGSYGILLKPEIEEAGMAEEKLTKGGFSFSGQVLYGVGRILSLGVEAGYLACLKDEFREPFFGLKVETGLSAIPVLGIIQLEIPSPLLSPYIQVGAGIYPLTIETFTIVFFLPAVEKHRETEFGIMTAMGLRIPLVPRINLDVGCKLHLIFTEGESTIMFNPGVGIAVKF